MEDFVEPTFSNEFIADLITLAGWVDQHRVWGSLPQGFSREFSDNLRFAHKFFNLSRVIKERETELKALGGTEAAERGWNALKALKPDLDGVDLFDELSHAKKVEYATFAQGLSESTARIWQTLDEVPFDVPFGIYKDGKHSEDKGYWRISGDLLIEFGYSGRRPLRPCEWNLGMVAKYAPFIEVNADGSDL